MVFASDPSYDLDEIDRQMQLSQDGRMPFSQIAKQLNVSPGMIRIRYNRLVEMDTCISWQSRTHGWIQNNGFVD
jgi:hypothetical protein